MLSDRKKTFFRFLQIQVTNTPETCGGLHFANSGIGREVRGVTGGRWDDACFHLRNSVAIRSRGQKVRKKG